MDTCTLEDVLALDRSAGGARASIYLPTARFGPDSQIENTARLKNLLKQATSELATFGLRSPAIEEMIEPVRRLSLDRGFWLGAGDGLAVFIGPDEQRPFRLPLAFTERCVVGHRYFLRPLLPLVETDRPFLLLALALKRVRLLRGDARGLVPVDLAGAPASLAEALRWDDYEKRSLQFHTETSGAPGGRRPAVFHGSGEPDPKDEITRYFRGIDRAIKEVADGSPVILAGVDYLIPLYREVSDLPTLVETSITGNPDTLGDDRLHAEAWRIVEKLVEAEREKDAARISEAWATPRTSGEVPALVSAALAGRIDVLFAALDAEAWGVVDEATGTVEAHERRSPGDEDLIGRAALATLKTGGTVHAVGAAQLPKGEVMVGLLRY